MASTFVPVDSHDLWLLVLSDVRYAMGRRSTAPTTASEHVRRYWPAFTAEQREQLLREVKQALHLEENWHSRLGDACDVQTWRELATWLEGKLGKRLTAQTREDAALILGAAACSIGFRAHFGVMQIADSLGLDEAAIKLALTALDAHASNEADAEAALRTGWLP